MYYQTKFGGRRIGSSGDGGNCQTLTLNAVTPFFHKTLWLMMMYHYTKFGFRRISSSEDIDERVIF